MTLTTLPAHGLVDLGRGAAGPKPAGLSRFAPSAILGTTTHYTGGSIARFYQTGTLAEGDARLWAAIVAEYKIRPGYSDVAYNFGLTRLGTIYQGRGIDCMNAANGRPDPGTAQARRWGTASTNPRFVSVIAFVGTDDGVLGDLTPAQVDALRRWNGYVADFYDLNPQTMEINGHRDVRSTDCPGDPIYGRLVRGELRPLAGLPVFEPALRHWSLWPIIPKPTISVMTPSAGMVRDAVRYLAGVLDALGYTTGVGPKGRPVDAGEWTVDLWQAVRSWQQSNRLTVDGIVGPSTWAAVDAAAARVAR